MLHVVNEGDGVHDLALDGGARTRRLDPGQSQRLDLGVIGGELPQPYCTLPSHKAAGISLDVQVRDGTADTGSGPAAGLRRRAS